jgi:hypothetical protein
MFIQLTTGQDSFRAAGGSMRRNVSCHSFVRIGLPHYDPVMPLFAAYTQKVPGFKETRVAQVFPATDKFGATDAGQWFVNRHEVMPGTEVMLEYRHRDPTSGFGESVEYCLLVADPTAPLWQIRIDLPFHHLSAVPSIFMEGRFHLVNKMSQLTQEAIETWSTRLGLDKDTPLTDMLDPFYKEEDQVFRYIKLEGALKKDVLVTNVVDGKTRIRIKRKRNIKTSS